MDAAEGKDLVPENQEEVADVGTEVVADAIDSADLVPEELDFSGAVGGHITELCVEEANTEAEKVSREEMFDLTD
jgi:hypothetical protein